ncbi:TPA: fimbrial assembly protein, partial [Klebsiella aerogenes]|nr:fimbrial assembly protein [Klebsiella aerogenes]HDG1135863.1 fimbrial assembly protein [Klebsiella aerogenes]
TYTDATNPGGASANETLTFRANYHKIGETITPGTANATGTITLQYN